MSEARVAEIPSLTDEDLIVYALRCLAEDCEDHRRPLMATRMRKLAEQIETVERALIPANG